MPAGATTPTTSPWRRRVGFPIVGPLNVRPAYRLDLGKSTPPCKSASRYLSSSHAPVARADRAPGGGAGAAPGRGAGGRAARGARGGSGRLRRCAHPELRGGGGDRARGGRGGRAARAPGGARHPPRRARPAPGAAARHAAHRQGAGLSAVRFSEARLSYLAHALLEEASLDARLDELARARIPRGVQPGSREWDVLYRRYREEERRKLLRS